MNEFTDHDPFCVIHKLGNEHCNCNPEEYEEDERDFDEYDEY